MKKSMLLNTGNQATVRMLFIAGVFIFTYTVLRAYLLSITWDESQSYYEYIKNGIVLQGKYDSISANNHILNTLGGIFFTTIFGVSEFTLRISSLIAHLFFLFYSAKLVLAFGNKWISLSAFLILNLNPYLLDFFSLARGYSISLGFMMASIYYLHLLLTTNYKTKNTITSLLYAVLATLGNLTLLNYCLVLYGVISILIVYNNINAVKITSSAIKKTIKQLFIPTLFILISLSFILPVSFKLKEAGALFMGGKEGFWTNTVGTIIPRLWYWLDFYWLRELTKGFFVLILVSATAYIAINHFKKKLTNNHRLLGLLLVIFYLIIIATIAQHYLLGTLYLIERTVLFLFVLWMLIFVFFINALYTERKTVQGIIHISAFIVLVHFLFSFNLKHVYEWKEDCETKEMLSDLEKIRSQPLEKFNVSIGIPLPMESSINYYRIVDNLNWLNQAERSRRINYLNDYFFLTPGDMEKVNKDSIEIIKTYPVTKNILGKPKYLFNKGAIVFDSTITPVEGGLFRMDSSMEYGPGYSYIFKDSLSPENSIISCKVELLVKQKLTGNVYLITSYQNKTGMYEWKNARLNDFYLKPGEPSVAYFTSFLPAVKPEDRLSVFIWNPNKQELFLKNMRLKRIKYSYK